MRFWERKLYSRSSPRPSRRARAIARACESRRAAVGAAIALVVPPELTSKARAEGSASSHCAEEGRGGWLPTKKSRSRPSFRRCRRELRWKTSKSLGEREKYFQSAKTVGQRNKKNSQSAGLTKPPQIHPFGQVGLMMISILVGAHDWRTVFQYHSPPKIPVIGA